MSISTHNHPNKMSVINGAFSFHPQAAGKRSTLKIYLLPWLVLIPTPTLCLVGGSGSQRGAPTPLKRLPLDPIDSKVPIWVEVSTNAGWVSLGVVAASLWGTKSYRHMLFSQEKLTENQSAELISLTPSNFSVLPVELCSQNSRYVSYLMQPLGGGWSKKPIKVGNPLKIYINITVLT